jgi:hypothetical protein
MRRLSLSKEEAVGRLVLFLEFQYARKQRPFSIKFVDSKFGSGFCEALTEAGWGTAAGGFFRYTPPENLINRPALSRAGKKAAQQKRDKKGRWNGHPRTYKTTKKLLVDAEGNERVSL